VCLISSAGRCRDRVSRLPGPYAHAHARSPRPLSVSHSAYRTAISAHCRSAARSKATAKQPRVNLEQPVDLVLERIKLRRSLRTAEPRWHARAPRRPHRVARQPRPARQLPDRHTAHEMRAAAPPNAPRPARLLLASVDTDRASLTTTPGRLRHRPRGSNLNRRRGVGFSPAPTATYGRRTGWTGDQSLGNLRVIVVRRASRRRRMSRSRSSGAGRERFEDGQLNFRRGPTRWVEWRGVRCLVGRHPLDDSDLVAGGATRGPPPPPARASLRREDAELRGATRASSGCGSRSAGSARA
jgi:hypothetical protein